MSADAPTTREEAEALVAALRAARDHALSSWQLERAIELMRIGIDALYPTEEVRERVKAATLAALIDVANAQRMALRKAQGLDISNVPPPAVSLFMRDAEATADAAIAALTGGKP